MAPRSATSGGLKAFQVANRHHLSIADKLSRSAAMREEWEVCDSPWGAGYSVENCGPAVDTGR